MTSREIKECKFSRAMSGYKLEEVDNLLDAVESDYEKFEQTINELNTKVSELTNEIEDFKKSQDSIQNVLLNAQKLADKIVFDAKNQAEEIIEDAKKELEVIQTKRDEVIKNIDAEAELRKNDVEKEISQVLTLANKKNESIAAATTESVNRQQMLFDKLKLEVAEFKAAVLRAYKEHIGILNALPDEVPMDPAYVTKIITTKFEQEPVEDEVVETEIVEKEEVIEEPEINEETGFVVEDIEPEALEEEED